MNATNKILLRLLGTALAMVGCAGCVVDSSEQAAEIEFAAIVQKSTKTIHNSTIFPTGETFVVYGYFSPNNFVNTSTYIMGETVAYEADNNWRCQSSTTYYWPISGSMKFFAYSPTTLSSSASSFGVNSSSGIVATGYRITTANMTDDFLYASSTVNCPPANPKTPISFSHALTQLRFTAQLAAEYTNGTNTVSVTINSITLNNIYSTGDFVQNPMSWRSQSGLQSYTVFSGNSSLITYVGALGTPVAVGTPVLMIPQTMPTSASLTVVYTISQINGAGTPYSDEVTITTPIDFRWDSNRKVTYGLKVKLNGIEFNVSDCEWASTTSGEILI